MKKIWLTLLSLVIAVLVQVPSVLADSNQVSFTKDANDNVLVKVTLPDKTKVNALKVTLKVDSTKTAKPSFEYDNAVASASKIHEVRYNATKKEMTLYLADLATADFSNGIKLGAFSNVTEKTTFSNQAAVEIVDDTATAQTIDVKESSLVVEGKKEETNDKNDDVDNKTDETDKKDDVTPDNKQDVNKDYEVTPTPNTKKDNQNALLGQTGESKTIFLTSIGVLVVGLTSVYYLKFRK